MDETESEYDVDEDAEDSSDVQKIEDVEDVVRGDSVIKIEDATGTIGSAEKVSAQNVDKVLGDINVDMRDGVGSKDKEDVGKLGHDVIIMIFGVKDIGLQLTLTRCSTICRNLDPGLLYWLAEALAHLYPSLSLQSDESVLADDRDLVEEGNPRSVTPLAVGDLFGSKSSDAIRDKKEKPISSCEPELSNGAGVSVGKEVSVPKPVVDGKGGKLEIPIFGDEVIKFAGTHMDLEKREHKVASEGDDGAEDGFTSEMGGFESERDGERDVAESKTEKGRTTNRGSLPVLQPQSQSFGHGSKECSFHKPAKIQEDVLQFGGCEKESEGKRVGVDPFGEQGEWTVVGKRKALGQDKKAMSPNRVKRHEGAHFFEGFDLCVRALVMAGWIWLQFRAMRHGWIWFAGWICKPWVF
ncbi:hypothetical protein U1Q18_040625 [Sarracenia purpurea var. burkii]